MNKGILFLFAMVLLSACTEYMPKPRGYFRIDLQEKSYKRFHTEGFPCSFEYADNVSVVKTSGVEADSVWVDIIYPQYNARIYGTYRKVDGNFAQLSEEAYKLVYQPHVSKAEGINTSFFSSDEHKVYGRATPRRTSSSPCRIAPATSCAGRSTSTLARTKTPSPLWWTTSRRISST